MKMKRMLLFPLLALVSCQEESPKAKVVIQIDEEKLAKVIVKSLVKGTARFSELAPDSSTNAAAELPVVADLIESEAVGIRTYFTESR